MHIFACNSFYSFGVRHWCLFTSKCLLFPSVSIYTEPGKPGKIGYFYEKSGKTRNSQGIFYNFYPSRGKLKERNSFSQHIMFINSCMVIRKVAVSFFVGKCELYHFT